VNKLTIARKNYLKLLSFSVERITSQLEKETSKDIKFEI
jgi:hypothetical protein